MPREHTLPERARVGWGAARSILERCKDKDRRELLADLVLQAGVRGAPAMEYVARRLRWHVDETEYPAPPGPERLSLFEVEFCERRALEVLAPYLDADDPRLSVKRKGLSEAA